MKRVMAVATIVLSLTAGRPALGWDPTGDDTVIEWPQPAAWTLEPAPVAPPSGVYLVTETYTGDSVTRDGAITTYSTDTVHEITGSYARVLESVGTGGSSAYDGAAFNGRAALTDGREVAGTYYQNYARTDGGFVAVSVVFFQDDSEIARASATVQPQPVAAPTPIPARVVAPPGIPTSASDPAAPATGRPEPAPRPRRSVPLSDRSIEVLRGRRTTLSLAGADVRDWRFLSGEGIVLGPVSGGSGDPFIARWDRLPPPGVTWIIRFLVAYADGTSHELVVRVAVRAPGLVE